MTLINQFLHFCHEAGFSNAIYDNFKYPTLLIHIIFLMIHRKHYPISWVKSLIAAVLMFAIGYSFSAVLGWAESGFKVWGANNIVRVFIYLPLICVLVAKLLKVKPLMMLTMLTPNVALQQVVGHTVCVFPGCCRGYPCDWGVWNPVTNSILFPNQWLECLVSLAIMVFLVFYQKKHNYTTNGKVYPIFLMLYGSTRFLLEFLRNNEKLWLGISSLAFHALFMTVVGIVWYTIVAENKREATQDEKIAI